MLACADVFTTLSVTWSGGGRGDSGLGFAKKDSAELLAKKKKKGGGGSFPSLNTIILKGNVY